MADFNGNNNIPSEPNVSPIDKPEFELPPQPNQFSQPNYEQPNYQDMNFQQPINLTNGMPPKKSKKKVIGIISAVAGVAACACVAVFAGPKIIDALSNSSKGAPIDRLKNSITESSKELSDSVLNSEKKAEEKANENLDTNVKLNVKLGDYIVGMIPEEYAGLQDTTLEAQVVGHDKQYYFDANLATPVATAVSMNGFVNMDALNVTMQIPDISDAYISTPIDLSGFDTESLNVQVPSMTSEEVVALLDDETKTLLESIKEVELKEDVTVTASGVSAKYDMLSTSIDGTEFANTVYACYERLTQESAMKEFFDLYAKESGVTIEDSLAELKAWTDSNKSGATLEFYMDDDDKIKGFVIIPDEHDGKNKIAFLTATDKSTGFEFYASEDDEKLFLVDGSYSDSNDVYTGNVKFTAYENGIASSTFEVGFKDVSCTDNSTKGTYTITSSELNGFTLTLDTNFAEKSGTLSFNVAMAAMDMATITLDYTVSEATSCPSLPSDAIVYDADTQSSEYLATADIMGFMTKFQSATGIDLSSLLYGGMGY